MIQAVAVAQSCLMLMAAILSSGQEARESEPDAPTLQSEVLVVHAGATTAHGLAILEESTFFLADSYSKEKRVVYKVMLPSDEDGNDEASNAPVREPFITIPMKQPSGLALSSGNDTLYVCDTAASRIYVHEAKDGRIKEAIDTAGMPWNLRVMADGSIWYLTTDGRLHRRTNDGRTSLVMNRETRQPVEMPTAFDFVVHPKTRELVVTQQEPGRVIAADPATGEMRVIADGLTNPEGIDVITFDDVVYFIVAETQANRIVAVEDREGAKPALILDGSVDEADGDVDAFRLPICVRAMSSQRVIVTARTVDERNPLILTFTFSVDD